jgi:hypothetical protein
MARPANAMQHDMARVALDFLGREHGEVPLTITQPITLLKVTGGEARNLGIILKKVNAGDASFHDPGKWP